MNLPDCTVAIYLDVPKALDMGIKLFRSANDVASQLPIAEPDVLAFNMFDS